MILMAINNNKNHRKNKIIMITQLKNIPKEKYNLSTATMIKIKRTYLKILI